MGRRMQRELRTVSILCGCLGLVGWALYLAAFSREPSQDWMVFHRAARAALDRDFALLLDGDRFTAALNQEFADLLSHPLPLHPWVYPPSFLLLILPFGILPFGAAQALFLALGFAALLAATNLFARDGVRRALYLGSMLLCPATAITVCLGQNAFLAAALLIGGLGIERRRPVLGGILLGLLTFKPQLWIMVPVALVALGRWRTLAATFGSALGLAAASVCAFGFEPWREWLVLMSGGNVLYSEWLVAGRLNGDSIYSCAMLLGASSTLAGLAQTGATLLAAIFVYRAYRRPTNDEMRLAVLLAATILAAPHTIAYDSVLLAFAATLLFSRGLDGRERPGETAIALLLWLSPLINPPSVFRLGLVTPLLIVAFILFAMLAGEPVNARPRSAAAL